jgi:hypothetical protein
MSSNHATHLSTSNGIDPGSVPCRFCGCSVFVVLADGDRQCNECQTKPTDNAPRPRRLDT